VPLVGKTNCDEFAMGSSNENSAFGVVRNPWDLGTVPGGSSGGSAAAVAAGEAVWALGTDTGGSVRQPAALCGVVGLKPTYGRVSRYGLIAFASSLDHVGTFSRDVRDAATLLSAIGGHDPLDATSLPDPAANYGEGLDDGVRGLRVGVVEDWLTMDGVQPGVGDAVRAAVDRLERLGATVDTRLAPARGYALSAYYLIAPAEASSNLAGSTASATGCGWPAGTPWR
jgi:aspartyl-tRNA(Asn)/glutamyl-tRNA(Gln) amidotransferase subunit A